MTLDGPCDVLDHATRKIPGEGLVRAWPDELVMSDEITALVERRWTENGL